MTLQPYSGSLLRLAITTIAIIAVLAGAMAAWESSAESSAPNSAHVRSTDLRS